LEAYFKKLVLLFSVCWGVVLMIFVSACILKIFSPRGFGIAVFLSMVVATTTLTALELGKSPDSAHPQAGRPYSNLPRCALEGGELVGPKSPIAVLAQKRIAEEKACAELKNPDQRRSRSARSGAQGGDEHGRVENHLQLRGLIHS